MYLDSLFLDNNLSYKCIFMEDKGKEKISMILRLICQSSLKYTELLELFCVFFCVEVITWGILAVF